MLQTELIGNLIKGRRNNNLFIEMFSKFFEKDYEKYLRIDTAVDCKAIPTKLIHELKSNSERKNFIKCLTKKTSNGFKIMRKLTTVHLLLMHGTQLEFIAEEFIANPLDSSDQWLNEQCIRTYYIFIKKIVASSELYEKTKLSESNDASFEKIFYLINLFTEMFKIVSKMPLLGRYFKESNENVTCSFVEGIAVQAQKIYQSFKNYLLEMLCNHRTYIQNRDEEQLMKAILEESLPHINEEMKKLFLDKYFYPFGKGIGIRLFRTEEQGEQTLKVIKGIISNHEDTERRNYQENMEKTLFPGDGKVNLEFYERTLKPSDKNEETVAIELDDIEEEEYIPTQFEIQLELNKKVKKKQVMDWKSSMKFDLIF